MSFLYICSAMLKLNGKVKKHGLQLNDNNVELWLDIELEENYGIIAIITGSTNETDENNFGYRIKRVLEILEVTDLNDVDGKPVRALFDAPENDVPLGVGIIGLQNFLTNDTFLTK